MNPEHAVRTVTENPWNARGRLTTRTNKPLELDSQGERIRRFVVDRQLSVTALARDLFHTERRRVYAWMLDEKRIPPRQLERFAEFLGVPLADVVITRTDRVTLKQAVAHPKLIDAFVEAPLDDRTRDWIRDTLATIYAHVERVRPALEARRKRIVTVSGRSIDRQERETNQQRYRERLIDERERTHQRAALRSRLTHEPPTEDDEV